LFAHEKYVRDNFGQFRCCIDLYDKKSAPIARLFKGDNLTEMEVWFLPFGLIESTLI
jgi:hypothetical protein